MEDSTTTDLFHYLFYVKPHWRKDRVTYRVSGVDVLLPVEYQGSEENAHPSKLGKVGKTSQRISICIQPKPMANGIFHVFLSLPTNVKRGKTNQMCCVAPRDNDFIVSRSTVGTYMYLRRKDKKVSANPTHFKKQLFAYNPSIEAAGSLMTAVEPRRYEQPNIAATGRGLECVGRL
jgi:hypothetical protein